MDVPRAIEEVRAYARAAGGALAEMRETATCASPSLIAMSVKYVIKTIRYTL